MNISAKRADPLGQGEPWHDEFQSAGSGFRRRRRGRGALRLPCQGDGVGGGVGPAVGDRDQDVADPPLAGDLLGAAADQDLGPTVRGRLRTSMSVQAMPRLQPVPIALRIASLAAQRPAKCSMACLRAWQ